MGGIRFDALLGKVRFRDRILQLPTDPSNPVSQDAWVLQQGGGGGEGSPIGLLLSLTNATTAGAETYELSYRTKEGTTKRVELT